MNLFDHFKPWKLVAEMEVITEWTGGLFFPNKRWTEAHTVAFYEKTPSIRKVKIIGEKNFQVKDRVESIVYKWRDHGSELPEGAVEIAG